MEFVRNMYFWTLFMGALALGFGISHIVRRRAVLSDEGGDSRIEFTDEDAIACGMLEVTLGIFLMGGVILDYFNYVSFTPVMEFVKAALEYPTSSK